MQASEVIDTEGTTSSMPGRLQQITASFIISLAPLNGGMAFGWISPMSLVLMGKDSPVGVITKDELALLAALPVYAILLSAPAFSYVVDRFGRKPGLLSVGIFGVISATTITYSSSKTVLYIGRLFVGYSAFGATLSQMYITETVHDSVRGVLNSFCTMQIHLGLVISRVVGNLLTYKEYNSIMILIPMIFSLLSLWVPESPHFLLDQSRKEDALKSFLWYRGENQSVAEDELRAMESSSASTPGEERMNCMELFKSTGTRRAMTISVFLYVFQALSGIQIVLNYDELIYEEVGSPLSSKDSSILLASLLLLGSCFGTLIVDKLGRKPLLYLSFCVGSLCMTILSIFLFLRIGGTMTNFSWTPFTCLNVFVLVYGMGLSFLPSLISTEVTSSRMRPAMSAVTTVLSIISVIIVLQSFPFLDESVGLYVVFVIPAIVNLLGAVLTLFVVPETKGKSLIQITNELNRR